MSIDDLEKEFGEWENEEEAEDDTPAPAQTVPDAIYDHGEEKGTAISIAGIGYSKNGKSLMGSLLPYLNQMWWTNSKAKEGKGIMIENYPLVKEMITTGVIPEVSILNVIDLQGSYHSKSKMGIFGRLTKPLYDKKLIKKTVIGTADKKKNISDPVSRELERLEVEMAKIKFDNAIKDVVADSDESVALFVDPTDDLERLLTKKFRCTWEVDIAPARPFKDGEKKDFYGASLDGIPQKFWYIRNSWFEDCLREQMKHKGFTYNTFKVELKENDSNYPEGFRINWTKRSQFYFDLVLWFDTGSYNAKVINRFAGDQDRKKPLDFNKAIVIDFTPRRPKAIYEIFERLAPSILGMVENEDGEYIYDNIWA